jgi:hypothetical protein
MVKSQPDFQESELSPRRASQVDDALRFIREQQNLPDLELNLHDEKELVKKIDWMLMPLMAVIYNLQYLDKTIRTDLFLIPYYTIIFAV